MMKWHKGWGKWKRDNKERELRQRWDWDHAKCIIKHVNDLICWVLAATGTWLWWNNTSLFSMWKVIEADFWPLTSETRTLSRLSNKAQQALTFSLTQRRELGLSLPPYQWLQKNNQHPNCFSTEDSRKGSKKRVSTHRSESLKQGNTLSQKRCCLPVFLSCFLWHQLWCWLLFVFLRWTQACRGWNRVEVWNKNGTQSLMGSILSCDWQLWEWLFARQASAGIDSCNILSEIVLCKGSDYPNIRAQKGGVTYLLSCFSCHDEVIMVEWGHSFCLPTTFKQYEKKETQKRNDYTNVNT